MFHIFVVFFSRDVKFPCSFLEKVRNRRESEREKLGGVGESFFFFSSPKRKKNFSLRFKKKPKICAHKTRSVCAL